MTDHDGWPERDAKVIPQSAEDAINELPEEYRDQGLFLYYLGVIHGGMASDALAVIERE